MDEPLSGMDDAPKFQIIPYLKTVSEEFRIRDPVPFPTSLVEMRLMVEQVVPSWTTGQSSSRRHPINWRATGWEQSRVGYINLLKLSALRRIDGLFAY